jgi:hypothetical protein
MPEERRWSYEEASEATVALHHRWTEYLAEQEQSDDAPSFADFFAWMFYTKGRIDATDRARRDRQAEIDRLGNDAARTIDGIHYFEGTASDPEVDDGPRHWLYS